MAIMIYQLLEGVLPFGEYRHHQQIAKKPEALSARQWQVLQSGFALSAHHRPASALALLQAMLQTEKISQTANVVTPSQVAPTLSPADIAAQQRAEQRRLRKELEQQRRQQASAALHALVEKQKRLQEQENSRIQQATAAYSQERDRVKVSNISWEEAQRYLAAVSQDGRSLM
jgi:hypothetical protein